MNRSTTDEQIAYASRQAEAGTAASYLVVPANIIERLVL